MADENQGLKKIDFKNYDKGLVSNVTNEALDDKELPILKNFDTNNRGGLVRRLGYRDIMPDDEVFDGVQQGYINFVAKPYSIEDYDMLFSFDKHVSPKETETAQSAKLLAVDGELLLVETNISGPGELKISTVFIPEDRNFTRDITFDNLTDSIIIENNSFGKLVIKVDSEAGV